MSHKTTFQTFRIHLKVFLWFHFSTPELRKPLEKDREYLEAVVIHNCNRMALVSYKYD